MIKAEKIKKCPRCGCETFYRKVYIFGKSRINYFFGQPMSSGGDIDRRGNWTGPDNSNMFDDLDFKEYKTAYCEECHIKV